MEITILSIGLSTDSPRRRIENLHTAVCQKILGLFSIMGVVFLYLGRKDFSAVCGNMEVVALTLDTNIP